MTRGVLERWRAVLGVTRTNNEGTRRLRHKVAVKVGEIIQARDWSEGELQVKRQTLANHQGRGFREAHGWTPDELKLLGKLPDTEVATRTGRTVKAVRVKRTKLGLLKPKSNAWTADEIALLASSPAAAVAH